MSVRTGRLRPILQPLALTYMAGHIVSVFGDVSLFLAINWLVYEKTGSATAVSVAALLEALPILLLGAPAGALVDRYDRRVLLIICDLVRVSAVLTVALLHERLGLFALYALILTENLASTVFMPARSAMLPSLLPRESIALANSVMGFTRQGVQIAAFGLGGVLLPILGFRGVALIDAGTFALSLLTLLVLLLRAGPQRRYNRDRSYGRTLLEGFQYAWRTRWVRLLLLVFAAGSFATAPVFTLTPIYAERVLGGNAATYGMLEACLVVGLLVGNLAGGVLERAGLGRLLIGGIACMGAGLLLAADTQAVWVGAAMYGIIGAAMAMINIAAFSLLQTRVPPRQQGRTFSLLTSVSAGATPFTLVVTGPLTDLFGLQPIFWAAGFLLFLVGAGAFLERTLPNVDRAPLARGQYSAGEA